jgi:hypothetical protein
VLQGSCPKNGAYNSIGSEGGAACVIPVEPIVMTPNAGEDVAVALSGGLQLLTVCHDGGQVKMAFQNVGASPAALNWFYGTGTDAIAGGAAIAAAGEQDFSFLSGRIEGQFIWSVGSQVITVNLHAVDLGGHFEVRGTAEHATV